MEFQEVAKHIQDKTFSTTVYWRKYLSLFEEISIAESIKGRYEEGAVQTFVMHLSNEVRDMVTGKLFP